jgi:hypothetical protein
MQPSMHSLPSPPLHAQGLFGWQRPQTAEPALAPAEAGERGGEIFRLEIGPHPLGEMKFGVGALPEQEIGQPLFAAGPDDEVDVPQIGFTGDEPRKAGACEIGQLADAGAALKIASRAE